MAMLRALFLALALLACADAFTPAAPLGRVAKGPALSRTSAFSVQPAPLRAQPSTTSPSVQMSLFGLGWPELLVIGGAALIFFGPDKLTDVAKEAGKSAGALKEASAAFQEGLNEANEELEGEKVTPVLKEDKKKEE
mmetsp:Transcript_21325/g.57393  ORF Transcript_21325/g.57393 Transcript_21325/m.57393 type:complete len:137 (-) Transcript_21325:220-630(-)